MLKPFGHILDYIRYFATTEALEAALLRLLCLCRTGTKLQWDSLRDAFHHLKRTTTVV